MNLFSRNFDLERLEAAARQAAAAVEESFTRAELEAQLAAAREAALAEGHRAGRAEAEAEARQAQETRAAEAAANIVTALAELQAGIEQHRLSVERDLLAFLTRAADTILPEVEQVIGPQRFEAEVRALVGRVAGSERIHIRVAPENLALLRRLIREAAPALPAPPGGDGTTAAPRDSLPKFSLAADPSLDATAVVARWQEGGSDHSFHKVCGAIRQLLGEASPSLRSISGPAIFRRHPRRAKPSAPTSMTGAVNG